MYKKILAVCTLLIITWSGMLSLLRAQTVCGQAVDQQTGEPLLFANVVLVRAADTVQITGTSSDAEGMFVFKKMPLGRYFIQVSTLGYHLANSPVFEVKDRRDSLSLQALLLSPTSVQLQEVEVRAKRPMVEMKPGKIVVNVAEHLASSTAENAYELLKKFPGVSIDHNDNLSLNGKSGVSVLVDGRNTYLSGSDLTNYLKALPATSVSHIEALTNPSSKYDAEGVGGIIDIKTDRKRERGFNGSLSAGGVKRLRSTEGYGTNASLDLNLRTEKMSLYGNVSYWNRDQYTYSKRKSVYADGSVLKNQNEEGLPNDSYMQGMWTRGGMDFYPTKQDVLGVSYRGSGFWNNNKYGGAMIWLSPSQNIMGILSDSAVSQNNIQNHNLTANYEHTFDSVYHRKLYTDFTWIRGITAGDGTFDMAQYRGNFTEEMLGYKENQLISLISDVYAFRADYEHPFSQQSTLETGVKLSYVNNNNDYRYKVDEVYDDKRSNRFLYNELIGAAYVMYSHNFATKTSLQVGLRGELTALRGYNVEMDSLNQRLYARPFPNINLSQEIGQNHRLNLAYRYRLTRPSYSDLNPFVARSGFNNYMGGNPYLNPEYSHNLDLTYSYKYNLFLTLGYVHTDGNIQNMTYYRKNDAMYESMDKPENMGRADFASLSLNGNYSFFDCWRLRFFLNGTYGSRTFDYALPQGDLKHENRLCYDATAWFGTDVDIIKTLTAELSVWSLVISQNMYDYTSPYVAMSLSVKKTFLKEKLSLTLTAGDMLGMWWKSSGRYPDGTKSSHAYWMGGQQLSLSLKYNFGNNKLMRAQRQSKSLEESERMGGGQGGNM